MNHVSDTAEHLLFTYTGITSKDGMDALGE
jgi:hypothetical protein